MQVHGWPAGCIESTEGELTQALPSHAARAAHAPTCADVAPGGGAQAARHTELPRPHGLHVQRNYCNLRGKAIPAVAGRQLCGWGQVCRKAQLGGCKRMPRHTPQEAAPAAVLCCLPGPLLC